MEVDASWCAFCNRLIPPRRCNIPLGPSLQAVALSSTSTRSSKAKIPHRGCGRLVQPGRRSKAPAQSQPHAIRAPRPILRTTSATGPVVQGLYCSDECKAADSNPIRPGPTICSEHAASIPPSPINRKYSSHTLALAQQLGFPPLPDLNKIVYADDSDREVVWQHDEYTGGVIMAARRIAEILPKPMKPRTSRYDPMPEVPKPIPGWTDGSNAWRASIYYNIRLHSDPTIGTTPRFRTTRGANAPCMEEQPADPTSDLYEGFNERISRRIESRTSPVLLSTSPDPRVRRERTFLPPHLVGKLLVPDVKLKLPPAPSASSSSRSSSSRRPPPNPSNHALLTPLRAQRTQPDPTRSWNIDSRLQYAPMKQPTRIVKGVKRVVGDDGKESWVEVEREELPQKLFLFPMARPMEPPPPGAILPTSITADS